MLSPIAVWRSLQGWTERYGTLLSALGYALAFAVMWGGVAFAAYTADFAGPVTSLVLGAFVIWFVRRYARGVRATQRLIDRLHPPERGEVSAAREVPGWAYFIYILLGIPLYFWISRQTGSESHATIAVLIAWFAGQEVLAYFFWRQSDPAAPSAFAIVDAALDRFAEAHRPQLRALGIAFGFVAMSGGVALQAYNSGFARAFAASHAQSDTMSMQIAIALGCGAAAILSARLYVSMTLGAQRALFDLWRYVRPEPPSRRIERWPLYLFALIGIALFLAMSFVGHEQAAGSNTMIIEAPRFKVEIGTIGLLALLIGWGGGGRMVLGHFWAKARERAERVQTQTSR